MTAHQRLQRRRHGLLRKTRGEAETDAKERDAGSECHDEGWNATQGDAEAID